MQAPCRGASPPLYVKNQLHYSLGVNPDEVVHLRTPPPPTTTTPISYTRLNGVTALYNNAYEARSYTNRALFMMT